MASSPDRTEDSPDGALSGVAAATAVAIGLFDGVFVGAPVALLAASFDATRVFIAATVTVVLLVVGCCGWIDRRWAERLSGQDTRIERRLRSMRASRLMRRPVAWIEHGSSRSYALAAAVANPILVAALTRSLTGNPIGERRILLGAVAYAIPYVAMWSIVGLALGEAIRAA